MADNDLRAKASAVASLAPLIKQHDGGIALVDFLVARRAYVLSQMIDAKGDVLLNLQGAAQELREVLKVINGRGDS